MSGTAPSAERREHYSVLDSFRGLCACLVALSHFRADSIFGGSPIFDNGSVYVDFFFVLSGFVIFANYARKLQNGFGLGKFVFLRFGRIYPLHFFVLAAFITADAVQLFLPSAGALYKPFSAPGESTGDIAANLFLVHSLHVSETLAFNGPSWSISVEFYTYILFGLILVSIRRFQKTFIALLGLCAAFLLYHLYGKLYAQLDYGFLRCVYGFACGGLTWEVFSRISPAFKRTEGGKRVFDAAEAVLLCLCAAYIHFLSQAGGWSMAAPLVFSGVIALFAFEGGFVSRFLQGKAFLFLGALSYSIYMTHLFIAGKFFEFPARVLERKTGLILAPERDGVKVFGENILSGTAWEVFYLLTVIACSYASYKVIEEPFRKFSRRLADGRSGKHNFQAGTA